MRDVADALNGARRVAIVSHRDPDPDTIGAALALGLGLESRGTRMSFHCADAVPVAAAFLPGAERFTRTAPSDDLDLVVTVDFGDPSRAALALPAVPLANIDHHASNAHFGTFNWVDPTSAATCEMVGRLIDAMGIAWTPAMATAALLGIMTDTGSFQFPATDARVYQRAAMLRDAGADLQAITYNAFRNERFEALRLRGAALARLVREEGGLLVWTIVTPVDLREAGATDADVSGLPQLVATSAGNRLALVFHEQEAAVKVSCRTSEWPPSVDAAALMRGFGGGGHVRAAGALVPGRPQDVRERVLGAARQALAQARTR